MALYLRIGRLLLDSGDYAEAEQYVNRASLLQTEKDCEAYNVEYKVLLTSGVFCRRDERWLFRRFMLECWTVEESSPMLRSVTTSFLWSLIFLRAIRKQHFPVRLRVQFLLLQVRGVFISLPFSTVDFVYSSGHFGELGHELPVIGKS